MRADRGVRRWAVVLAALLAAATPMPAAAAAPPRPADPVGVLTASDDGPSDSKPEPVTDAARAAALAEPAIVQIEVRWDGYVRDRSTGEVLDPDRVSASTQCTGAGVGHEGYLLTTGSCLDQATVAAEAFRQVVDRRVAGGSLSAAEADVLLAQLLIGARIGGPPGDDPPERSVLVRRAVTDDEPLPATVVSIADPADGDAALLKINRSNQPVLPLAGDNELALGTELVTIECPPDREGFAGASPTTAAVDGDRDGDEATGDPLRPTFRAGEVAETSPRVVVQPSGPAGPSNPMAGGVVLTHGAAIAGLVDTSLGSGDVLVELSAIRDMLTEAEVDTELGQLDRDYRAGLDAYYQGRYGEAIARFDAVLAVIPSHLQAHQYRDAAQSRRDGQEVEPPPADEVVDQVETWLDQLETWLGSSRTWLVGVVMLIAIVAFLVRSRRPDGTDDDGDTATAPADAAEAAASRTTPEDAPAGDAAGRP